MPRSSPITRTKPRAFLLGVHERLEAMGPHNNQYASSEGLQTIGIINLLSKTLQ
jgi:hypothetical protein